MSLTPNGRRGEKRRGEKEIKNGGEKRRKKGEVGGIVLPSILTNRPLKDRGGKERKTSQGRKQNDRRVFLRETARPN